MSDRELIHALRQNPTGCGSFRKDQLDRPLVENELVRRGYSLAAIALLLALQLCALEVSGQTLSPNDHISITSAVSSTSGTGNNTALTIRECKVIDQEGYPLPYATIAVLNKDSMIIGGEVTDSIGSAIMKLSVEAASVRVSYIGYQHQVIRLEELQEGLIELVPLSNQLPQATITALRGNTWRGGFSSSSITWITTKNEVWNNDSPANLASKLNLFPNPSKGQSTLQSELLKEAILINVYSSVGQLVLSIPIVDGSKNSVTLRLGNHLTSGNYIVELVLKNGSTEVVQWLVAR